MRLFTSRKKNDAAAGKGAGKKFGGKCHAVAVRGCQIVVASGTGSVRSGSGKCRIGQIPKTIFVGEQGGAVRAIQGKEDQQCIVLRVILEIGGTGHGGGALKLYIPTRPNGARSCQNRGFRSNKSLNATNIPEQEKTIKPRKMALLSSLLTSLRKRESVGG